jgi:hypothetical protein
MSMHERHSAILAELSEIGLSSARDLHAQQLAAETPERKAMLASALHRISRSVRQTLALEARLVRDALRQDREDQAAAQDAVVARKTRRSAQVKATVERLIWMEHEKDGEDADHLVECLGELLGEDILHDDFDTEPLEAHIAQLCASLGLSPPPCGEGAGGGGVSSELATSGANPLPQPEAHSQHPNPSPQGGGAADDDDLLSDDDWRASG